MGNNSMGPIRDNSNLKVILNCNYLDLDYRRLRLAIYEHNITIYMLCWDMKWQAKWFSLVSA